MVSQSGNTRHIFSALMLFPLAAAKQEMTPLRAIVIGGVALLWLFCFSALFSKDKRKSRLQYLQKRKLMAGFVERRGSQRISYPMFVLYRVMNDTRKDGDAMLMANARDLSETGILLELKQDVPENARLELKLALGAKAGSLILRGTVQRKEWLPTIGIFAVGLLLEQGSGQDSNKLAQFIEQELKKEEAA